MSQYDGRKCLICENRFAKGDDVVVCPECGTPYHRECYQKEGRCVNTAQHEAHEEWNEAAEREKDAAERLHEEQKYDASLPLRCPKCGTINPPEGIFCQICGTPLNNAHGPYAEGIPQNPDPIPMNPYTTPYGGVSPDEEINGVPVRDIALFIGENSHYFIPKFKEMVSGRKVPGWNWPAFLFSGFYLLYRKLYLLGALVLLVAGLLAVPGFLLNYCVLFNMPGLFGISLMSLWRIQAFCGAMQLFLTLLCGSFANRIYGFHVLRKVRGIRERCGNDRYGQEYITALTKSGRTNRTILIITFLVMAAGSLFLSVLLAASIF